MIIGRGQLNYETATTADTNLLSQCYSFDILLARWVVPILSSDMLEGILRHTNMVKGVVVQWGIEQVVVALQEDEGLGVAESTRQGVVLQEDEGPGVVEGRTWMGVAEDRT